MQQRKDTFQKCATDISIVQLDHKFTRVQNPGGGYGMFFQKILGRDHDVVYDSKVRVPYFWFLLHFISKFFENFLAGVPVLSPPPPYPPPAYICELDSAITILEPYYFSLTAKFVSWLKTNWREGRGSTHLLPFDSIWLDFYLPARDLMFYFSSDFIILFKVVFIDVDACVPCIASQRDLQILSPSI